MKNFRKFALLGILLGLLFVPATLQHAQAQVAVGIGVGVPYAAPPVCAYGYYGYYPYACAPYGYYGPNYFVDGIFIGAGPWFRGYGFRGYGFRPGYYGYRGGYPIGYRGGFAGGYRGGFGGGFHAGAGFHGGGFGGRR